MPFVSPKGRTRPDLPPIHAASAVYALTEVQRHRGGLACLLYTSPSPRDS